MRIVYEDLAGECGGGEAGVKAVVAADGDGASAYLVVKAQRENRHQHFVADRQSRWLIEKGGDNEASSVDG